MMLRFKKYIKFYVVLMTILSVIYVVQFIELKRRLHTKRAGIEMTKDVIREVTREEDSVITKHVPREVNREEDSVITKLEPREVTKEADSVITKHVPREVTKKTQAIVTKYVQIEVPKKTQASIRKYTPREMTMKTQANIRKYTPREVTLKTQANKTTYVPREGTKKAQESITTHAPRDVTKKEQAQIRTHAPREIKVETETNVTKRFSERRSLVRKKCASSNSTHRHVLDVTGYAPARFTICNVPKAACTLWLRLFTYLINKKYTNRSLASFSKHDVHYRFDKSREKYRFNDGNRTYIMKSVRAVTSRNPYTRLWSAYIDKIFLPDFWKGKGRKIINMTRPNATDFAKRCGNDVTFPEFVQYVLNVGHSVDHWGFDFHWLPVTDICDPCAYKPDFILKQETFLSDFNHVMDHVGLSAEAEPIFKVNEDKRDIVSEIDYNFRIYRGVSHCATKLQLAKLIWKAMKLNGYLQPNDDFPAELKEENVSRATIILAMHTASGRHKGDLNKQTKKAIRKQALIDAYRQLSLNQLTSLQQFYQTDFEMFGYNSSPPG